jgi:hypothetical protein
VEPVTQVNPYRFLRMVFTTYPRLARWQTQGYYPFPWTLNRYPTAGPFDHEKNFLGLTVGSSPPSFLKGRILQISRQTLTLPMIFPAESPNYGRAPHTYDMPPVAHSFDRSSPHCFIGSSLKLRKHSATIRLLALLGMPFGP